MDSPEPNQNGHYVGQRVWTHAVNSIGTITKINKEGFPHVKCDGEPDYGRSGWFHPDAVEDLRKRDKRRLLELQKEIKAINMRLLS